MIYEIRYKKQKKHMLRLVLIANQVEVDDNEISIGTLIGSGSFAEVRHGRLKGFRSDGVGLPVATKTSDTILSRARSVGPVPPKIAVKILRDVKRQAIRRFWIEVLIMKVRCAVLGGVGRYWEGMEVKQNPR